MIGLDLFSWWIIAVFIAYFAALIGIAVVRSRQMQGMTDYVLGGRRMGIITSALSSGSSTASGWTMLVFPALAFAAGMMHLWDGVLHCAGRLGGLDCDGATPAPLYNRHGRLLDRAGISGEALWRRQRRSALPVGIHQPLLHHPVRLLRPDCRRQAAGSGLRLGPPQGPATR